MEIRDDKTFCNRRHTSSSPISSLSLPQRHSAGVVSPRRRLSSRIRLVDRDPLDGQPALHTGQGMLVGIAHEVAPDRDVEDGEESAAGAPFPAIALLGRLPGAVHREVRAAVELPVERLPRVVRMRQVDLECPGVKFPAVEVREAKRLRVFARHVRLMHRALVLARAVLQLHDVPFAAFRPGGLFLVRNGSR